MEPYIFAPILYINLDKKLNKFLFNEEVMQTLENKKAFFKWCELSDREKFAISRCLMPISVGQKIHEGKDFYATVKRINSSFKECVILIDDSIQRHTMKFTKPYASKEIPIAEVDLYKISIKMGDEWLIRNKNILDTFSIPINIIRWDKWLFHPLFNERKKLIDNLYVNDNYFKNSVNITICNFLNRLIVRNELVLDYETSFQYCIDYIKEECAALTLWTEENCNYEVYPSGRNEAMIATYNLLIKDKHPNLLKSVALYFKTSRSKSLEIENELLEEAIG